VQCCLADERGERSREAVGVTGVLVAPGMLNVPRGGYFSTPRGVERVLVGGHGATNHVEVAASS
jgi:hypothetical protein